MENRDIDIKDVAYYRSRWDYDAILEKAKIDFSLAGPCFGVILDLKEVIKELICAGLILISLQKLWLSHFL